MRSAELRDTHLGKWSSHPYWAKSRARWYYLGAFLPVAIVVLLAVFVVINYRNWVQFLLSAPTWLLVAGVAGACTIAALMTLALSARWSQVQWITRMEGDAGAERVSWGKCTVVFLVGLAIGCLGPLGVSQLTVLAPPVRMGFHLFAFLPLVAVLAAMWVLGARVKDPRYAVRRRPIWLLILLAVLALMSITLLYDLGEAFGNSALTDRIGNWIPWYRTIGKRFIGLLILLPVAFLIFLCWQLWVRVVPTGPSRPREDEASEQGKRTPMQRLLGWLKNLFRRREEPAEPEAERRPPDWLADLLRRLPEGCEVVGSVEELAPEKSSPVVENSPLKTVFGGLDPTQDQVDLFERFLKSYRELLSSVPNGSREAAASADLLVEGDPGSGKTTALLACAVYAAFARGQRVLFLVANGRRQVVIRERIHRFVRSLHMHYYVRVEALSDTAVEEWMKPDTVLPHIAIATVDSMERDFYGAPYKTGSSFERLRALLLLFEVLLVDDLMDLDDAQRSHLPFLLDKQRLLLSSEYLPVQIVVTCPKLAKTAEELLGTRLFTEKGLKPGLNVFKFRPPPGRHGWKVDLTIPDAPPSATEVPDVVETLAVQCLERDLDVVVYRKGMDEVEGRRQRRAIVRRANRENIAILGELDQPLTFLPTDVDAIFYQVAVHEDVCLALRSHMGHEDTVIFSLVPRGHVREEIDTGIVPILPDRAATPLLVAHFRSALRFLRSNVPVAGDAWSRFGVMYGELAEGSPRDTVPDALLDYDSWSEDAYAGILWPFVTRHGVYTGYEAINVYQVQDETRRIYRCRDRSSFFVGSPRARQPADGRGRYHAAWLTSAREPLREIDLIHMRDARLTYGSSVFVPERIQQKGKVIEFTTKHLQGRGDDPYLPFFDVGWDLGNELLAEPLGGNQQEGISWFEMLGGGSPADIRIRIKALMDDYGIATPIPTVRYEYPALFSGIILAPTGIDSDEIRTRVGNALQGNWETGEDTGFWPELTGAMNYALEARVPGLTYFSRCIAFGLTGSREDVGKSVIWLAEPWASGRIVLRVLSRLLTDRQERAGLFSSARWFLDRLAESPSPTCFMRRYSGIGYEGDDSLTQAGPARELVERVLRSIAALSDAA